MTRTEESPGGLERRARISSAEARLPRENTAFMISRSRLVSGCVFFCDTCHSLHATIVACQVFSRSVCERGHPVPEHSYTRSTVIRQDGRRGRELSDSDGLRVGGPGSVYAAGEVHG